jgi:hypothetical protein
MPEVSLFESIETISEDEPSTSIGEETLHKTYTEEQLAWFKSKANESKVFIDSKEWLDLKDFLENYSDDTLNESFLNTCSNLCDKAAWHAMSLVQSKMSQDITEWFYFKYELAMLRWMTPPWLYKQAMKDYEELRG